MGTTASVTKTDDIDNKTKVQVQVPAHPIELFQSSKQPDGLVTGNTSPASSAIEQEVFALFAKYTVDGELMDNACFLELLRDAKVLSKGDLTVHYANMIFREHTSKLQPPKRMNFNYFRRVVVPLLAAQKSLGEAQLLARLSHVESFTVKLALSDDQESDDRAEDSREAHELARKLQAAARKRNAGRQLSFMRQCSFVRADPTVARAFEAPRLSGPAEQKLLGVFQRYTEVYASNAEFAHAMHQNTVGQLERKQFFKLCSHAKLTSDDFSASDCNHVFDKAKALAMNPAMPPQYAADVFFNKRVGFTVFRDVMTVCLAEQVGRTVEDLLSRLQAVSPSALAPEKLRLDEGSDSMRSAASASVRRALDERNSRN